MDRRNREIAALLDREDHAGLAAVARGSLGRVLRYLVGRLSSADPEEKYRAVRALGCLASDRALVPRGRVEELLRRFLWALTDESGAVPWGVPEAMAEVLAVRAELQGDYLPILGSYLASADLGQTGAIEQGVIWGLGRLGAAVAEHAPHALEALRHTAEHHPDPATRHAAELALRATEPR